METINMKSGDYAQAYAISDERSVMGGEVGSQLKKTLLECLDMICSDSVYEGTEGAGFYKGLAGAGYCLEQLLRSRIQLPEKVEKDCRQAANRIYQKAQSMGMSRSITFLNGTPGLFVYTAIYGGQSMTSQLLSLSRDILNSPSGECELLYGRAGYLQALLSIQSSVEPRYQNRYNDVLIKVVRQIGEEGTATSAKYKNQVPKEQHLTLMYEWHNKMYYGAAHGVVGILYVLLQCPPEIIASASPTLMQRITNTVSELVELVSNSVYPSSLGSSSGGRLCQFCHGATGFALLFSKMFKITRDRVYLEAASRAALHVVHNTKTKGVGLCHGVTGNIYALLALYRVSNDIQWLQFTVHMTLFLCDDYFHIYQHSDRPLSLFEGLPAVVCLLTTLLTDPSNAKFPGFDS
eukprot:TRINITY_DN16492_c0_g1_i1.p1 TRINITY_DN16492_c0_g1~~TRINITY_DN16492_c0_g1_i1.p1  ORF type:complete len:428 (+),score=57.63 TRINITY_DN16492_c0_g1_i1:68-1285(+)